MSFLTISNCAAAALLSTLMLASLAATFDNILA